MVILGNALILLALAMILFLAVIAVIRGIKGIKTSRRFEASNKKVRISYLVLSIVHLTAGILVTMSYLMVGLTIMTSL